MSPVPPKISRSGRKMLPKMRGAKSKHRVTGKQDMDGFVDDELLGEEDDGADEAEREAQANRHMSRDEQGPEGQMVDPRGQKQRETQEKEQAEAKHAEEQKPKFEAQEKPAQRLRTTAPKKPVTDGQAELERLKAKVEKMEKTSSINPPGYKPSAENAMTFLHNAKPPGSFFKELSTHPDGGNDASGAPQEEVDPELLAAVEDTKVLMKDVNGVSRIAPGKDDEETPVVLIAIVKGFTQASLGKVPEKVRAFQTLLAIPYDILPLKRLGA